VVKTTAKRKLVLGCLLVAALGWATVELTRQSREIGREGRGGSGAGDLILPPPATTNESPRSISRESALSQIPAPPPRINSPVGAITPYPEPRSTAIIGSVGTTSGPAPVSTPPPETSVAPGLQALREIGTLGEPPDSTRIGGTVSRAPRVLGAAGVEPTATPDVVDLLEPVVGQARGFKMLPLMHPRARPMVEAQIETLLRSQIQQIYLGVLVDGTFSLDLDYLLDVIQRLNAGARELTLVLHFVSGPTMRDYDTTPIVTAFSRTNPFDFRELIKFDPRTKYRFESIVRRMVPALRLNRSLKPGNRSIAIVMLEDNLDAESYRAMRATAAAVLGPDIEIMRNPCVGCWEGNDGDPQGNALELHAPTSPASLGRRDGYTMDGAGYIFPGERRLPREYSIEETFALIDATMSRGVSYFGLWRARRQGIVGGELVHPDLRVYEVPTIEQSEIEIQLLRHGLIPRGPLE